MDVNQVLADTAASVTLALIAAVGASVVAFLRRHVGAARLEAGGAIARTAVAAVEQLAVARGWKSADKFEGALARCRDLAVRAGVSFTDAQWATLIEQGVAELKQLGRELAPDPAPAPLPPGVVSRPA